MDLLTLDFETTYSQDYTLSNMTTEAYVRDPRFEMILVGVKFGHTPAMWMLRDRFEHLVQSEIDWSQTALVAHHAHFDGLILSHHFGCNPAMWIDTLSMARVIDGPKAGNSLRDLCIRHGVGYKGDYVLNAKGKRLADFTPQELRAYGSYCCNDCDRTYDLANTFLPQMPGDELRLIDLTVRMFTEPKLQGNVDMLRGAVVAERQRKKKMLTDLGYICATCSGDGQITDLVHGLVPCKKCDGLGIDKKPFSSNEQFAAILRSHGVEPETKTSGTTGEQIYAFAKTDPAMQSLLEDEDELIRALAEARVSMKSTIIETRAQRFLGLAERGAMSVYLKYGGAHTLRWSGGDGTNFQNMSNDIENAPRPEMAVLKQAIHAPAGHKIVAADSGQGEARILAWLAGQQDLVEAFAQGRDVYSEHASTVYGRPVDRKKVKADYIPGQVGKISILSFGFGSGWYTAAMGFLKGVLGAPPIQFTKADMEALGVDPSRFLNAPKKVARVAEMPSRLEMQDRLIHCIVTEALVQRYRKRYPKIPEFWDQMEHVINAMIRGEEMVFGAHGVFRTGKECIHLPNGMKLNYRGLQRDENANASYFDGRTRTKIYSSLLTENIVQCAHRLVVAGQMLEISEVLPVALMTHDDVGTVVPDDSAEMALQFMLQTMKKAPAWAPGLPLTGEGGIGQTLAEAK